MDIALEPARLDWLEALSLGDHELTDRFGIPVVAGWIGFPEALPHALDAARRNDADPWGSHLIFEGGALVGFGGFKGEPVDGAVEIGYAVAPSCRGRGIATAATRWMIDRAEGAGVTLVVAHTLAEENPSTSVLERCGFTLVGSVPDPDGGVDDDVWRWERAVRAADQAAG